MKKLDITYTDEELQPIVDWCDMEENNHYWSSRQGLFAPVITKNNKKGNWSAMSLKGYDPDPSVISKPNVLGVGSDGLLQETYLYKDLNISFLMDKIPAETERVRLMNLRHGEKIPKHTDRVDKDIKDGKIVRLHVPTITNENISMISWLDGRDKDPTEFKMKKGECWWLDVSKPHSVINASKTDRVHLVIDVYKNDLIP